MKKYTYGIGASWVLELRGYAGVRRLVQFTVKDCRLKRGVEYYDVEQREQGKEVQQIEDMSASRLHYLINFHCIEKLSSGRAADYPLTPAEVTEYYKTLTADKARSHDHGADPQPYGASGRDQSGVRYQRRGSDNGVRLPDLQRPRRAWERRDLRMCESA